MQNEMDCLNSTTVWSLNAIREVYRNMLWCYSSVGGTKTNITVGCLFVFLSLSTRLHRGHHGCVVCCCVSCLIFSLACGGSRIFHD